MPQPLRNFRPWLRLGAVCLGLCAVAACHKKPAAASDSTPIDQAHPPDRIAGATPLATLERTGCYGKFPVYRLTVNTDGSVVYVGTRWVKVLGRQEYKLTEAQLSELQSAFERASFMVLRDYDHVEGTDDDWAHLSLMSAGRTKRVRHYHGDNAAPPTLNALEDEFDRIVDSGRFVGLAAAGGTLPPATPRPMAAPSASTAAPSESVAAPSESAKGQSS